MLLLLSVSLYKLYFLFIGVGFVDIFFIILSGKPILNFGKIKQDDNYMHNFNLKLSYFWLSFSFYSNVRYNLKFFVDKLIKENYNIEALEG